MLGGGRRVRNCWVRKKGGGHTVVNGVPRLVYGAMTGARNELSERRKR